MTPVKFSDQLNVYRAEFHIHTVLSPCASVEMIPPLIIQEAVEKGIKIIAISDHNATANIDAVIQAAKDTEITVIPGIELHTREEIHILCLFPNPTAAHQFQAVLEPYLPKTNNQEDVFGPQYVVDATGEYIRHEERMLSQATSLSIEHAWSLVKQFDGLFIPAHINRSMYGLLPTLGFLPENIPFDALEINQHDNRDDLLKKHPDIQGIPLICSGDAHNLEDIYGLNLLTLNKPTLDEIRKALKNEDGRKIKLYNGVVSLS